MIRKVYGAFFLGQGPLFNFGWGGSLTSYGIVRMAGRARALGMATDTWRFDDFENAATKINRMRLANYMILLLGYSLGVSAITALQLRPGFKIDELIAIAGSSLGENYAISHSNTKKSLLFTGSGALSGIDDPLVVRSFDEVVQVPGVPHLLMDFVQPVNDRCIAEFRKLLALT